MQRWNQVRLLRVALHQAALEDGVKIDQRDVVGVDVVKRNGPAAVIGAASPAHGFRAGQGGGGGQSACCVEDPRDWRPVGGCPIARAIRQRGNPAVVGLDAGAGRLAADAGLHHQS
jgi:hypothetical protein